MAIKWFVALNIVKLKLETPNFFLQLSNFLEQLFVIFRQNLCLFLSVLTHLCEPFLRIFFLDVVYHLGRKLVKFIANMLTEKLGLMKVLVQALQTLTVLEGACCHGSLLF
jgi:hypothetical protein